MVDIKKQLCVNIDHVATLRQARKMGEPCVIAAAKIVQDMGAKGVTVHLREDRRHIQDHDVFELRKTVRYLNLEMANTLEMVQIAEKVCPNAVCLVPEKREELTTEGGLNVIAQLDDIRDAVMRLTPKGIKVSVFIEPEMDQISAAAQAGASIVELHTGTYALTPDSFQLARLTDAARTAYESGLIVHAGHGLSVSNLKALVAIPEIEDLNIGFSIIASAVLIGLPAAIQEVLELI